MENSNHPLLNWIPYKLIEKDQEVYFEWLYLSDKKYLEPFFEGTIAICKSHLYNSSGFKIVSTAENIIDWSRQLHSVELTSLVFHVSRCGSTMLSQSLSTSSENIMISEAPIIDQIVRSELFSAAKKDVLLKAVLKILGQKRFPEQKYLIIKLDAWHIFKAFYFRTLFSKIPFALLYRNPTEVLKSHQKMAGMHMIPNVLPANVFGISTEEANDVGFRQYGALVLEKYFQGFLDFYSKDQNVVLLNYNDGMHLVIERFISFILVNYSGNELDKMYDRLKSHSKDKNTVFTGDVFKTETLEVDFTIVNSLHEKLNKNLIRI